MENPENSTALLSEVDRNTLENLIQDGLESNQRATHARILLGLDKATPVDVLATILGTSESNVDEVRTRYEDHGLASLDEIPAVSQEAGVDESIEHEQVPAAEAHASVDGSGNTTNVPQKEGGRFAFRGIRSKLSEIGQKFKRPSQLGKLADSEKQEDFIESYETVKGSFSDDEGF